MIVKENKIAVITSSGNKKYITQYKLMPNNGCILKNKLTNAIIKTFVVLKDEQEIINYEEIEW